MLLILLSYAFWLNRNTFTTPVMNTSSPDNVPDFFIKDINVLEFSPEGTPLHALKTPYLVHYPVGDTALLTKPYFIAYSEKADKQPWFISADKGKTEHGTNILHLIHHVLVEQTNAKSKPSLTLKTEQLTIYPKENFAQTEQPVTIEEPGIEVNSIGMKVYFKEKRVELLNHTAGVYDVSKATPDNKA